MLTPDQSKGLAMSKRKSLVELFAGRPFALTITEGVATARETGLMAGWLLHLIRSECRH
jgi:hypothetical protein